MRKLPHTLNSEEIWRILAVIQHPRDKALFALMSDAGMRVSEVCDLLADNLKLEDRLLKVKGKGGKERMIPFTQAAADLCACYAKERLPSVYFFTNADGERLSRQYVWQLCRRYGKQAGIVRPFSPHTFRHSKATYLLDHGVDLRYVQEFLGHESVNTTQIYTHVSVHRLSVIHNQFHPRH